MKLTINIFNVKAAALQNLLEDDFPQDVKEDLVESVARAYVNSISSQLSNWSISPKIKVVDDKSSPQFCCENCDDNEEDRFLDILNQIDGPAFNVALGELPGFGITSDVEDAENDL